MKNKKQTNSQPKYAPKNLEAMREAKCSRSDVIGVGSRNDEPVNVSEKQKADNQSPTQIQKLEKEIIHLKYWIITWIINKEPKNWRELMLKELYK